MRPQPARNRLFAGALALLFLLMSVVVPTTQAGMVGTQQYASSEAVEAQRADVKAMLARDDVREQLVQWGVDPGEASARVDALTPGEVQQLAERMDSMPAGAGVGSVVGAAVLVFLVLLITDILGFTNVFPFVTKTVD